MRPALAGLAARLGAVPGLSDGEREVVQAGAAGSLAAVVWSQVRPVVLVEFHAARIAGQLRATDSGERWREWVDRLAGHGGWERIADPYPVLLPRLRMLVAHRCAAAYQLAARFARDRPLLTGPSGLAGAPVGRLAEVRFGAGDSHQGGQTVSLLRLAGGRLVYKPRSVAVDAALARMLRDLLAGQPAGTRIAVPPVLPRRDLGGEYGWAGHVAHRYCRDDAELRIFYRGVGHWLAVMRLLGGSDLHAENLIAAGPVPVVVDCETLFTPYREGLARGYGAAVERAVELLSQSVLRTGLLPGRAAAGRQGVDISAAGYLPDQQPTVRVPAILDPGTDRARLGRVELASGDRPRTNHPSPAPDLERYWERVVDGYTELSGLLRARDAAGALAPALVGFSGCPIRVLVRDTSSYAELMRVLWHPSALYEPEPAIRRVTGLLARQADHAPGVPADPAVIAAEVAELLVGDVPVFTTTPTDGVLAGPRGTRWGEPQDLVAGALSRWRAADPDTDRRVIRSALVGAYLSDPPAAPGGRPAPVAGLLRSGDPDRCRRRLAAAILRQLADSAIRGRDGTVTWVAPMREPAGWVVRPATTDLYNGLAGLAVLFAGYRQEAGQGRADPVPGLDALLAAVLRTLRLAEDQHATAREAAVRDGLLSRPEPPGGYFGLGSRIWAWLLLHRLGAIPAGQARQRAGALAVLLPEALAADPDHDLAAGSAGAVVPLLRLAEHTGQHRWRELAGTIGERLREQARPAGPGVQWPNGPHSTPTVGAAHGAAGIGWAMARLAHATRDRRAGDLARAAFGWVESRFEPQRRNWRNPGWRGEAPGRSWCHGAPGIGVCAADLLAMGASGPAGRWRELLARAAGASWPDDGQPGSSLCHGRLGRWEVLDRAHRAGVGPADFEAVTAQLVAAVAQGGPATGATRDAARPGLLVGAGGIAYQLLRMHPAAELPSVLLPDPGPPDPR